MIRINLGAKLFTAIFATSVASVIAMGAIASYNLSTGFVGYLNQQALARTKALEKPLIRAYESDGGSWRFMRNDPRRWFDILRTSTFDPSRHAPPAADLLGANLRIGLFDASGRHVIGAPRDPEQGEPRWLALKRANGQLIGWLMLTPIQKATSQADVQFQRRQSTAIWLFAGIALMLSALLAWLLARTLLTPIRRIADATHRLAAGYYDARVTLGRGDEIGRLALDFNHLADTLARNEAMRRRMMADISHELRTPLSVLRGELEALEDGVRPFTPEATRSLTSEIGLLSQLVDDLYELSLSDAGALAYRKTEIDVTALLGDLEESHRGRFAQADLCIHWELPETPVWLLADEDRLIQLFQNLLENSLRYTNAGGEVRVRMQTADGSIEVWLEDSAPGVDAGERERMFERFYRADVSRSRASGGSGLGLAICRNIVEAHGGTIVARASELGGVGVCVTLPLGAPRASRGAYAG
ncbi:ATP-binding protein [Salinisphaera hydrothermalis]|uniref:ATP-binding protein n=1 Tax=Salinisphaera hydrothermalis TaxID=563188 RepID=UPI00068FA71D|nr:ATP-binding protein [Salinisphaera hydrothermalis]